jgi:hypothetical protein
MARSWVYALLEVPRPLNQALKIAAIREGLTLHNACLVAFREFLAHRGVPVEAPEVSAADRTATTSP